MKQIITAPVQAITGKVCADEQGRVDHNAAQAEAASAITTQIDCFLFLVLVNQYLRGWDLWHTLFWAIISHVDIYIFSFFSQATLQT